MENNTIKEKTAGIKIFIVSAILSAAVWLWSIFSNQTVQNLNKTNANQTNNDQQPVSVQSDASATLNAASGSQTTLRNVTSDTQSLSSQPVVQPVVVNSGNPVTSTSSSRP